MNGINERFSKMRRQAAGLQAVAFVFFWIYSAPHRVHHFFEEFARPNHAHAHEHDRPSDQHEDSTKNPDCVFQVSTSRCDLSQPEQTTILSIQLTTEDLVPALNCDGQRQTHRGILPIRDPPSL